MKLKVITPDELLFEQEITRLNVTSKEGGFSVLKGHAPLIVTLVEATIQIDDEAGQKVYMKLNTGTLKVLNNVVTLFADYGVVSESKDEVEQHFVARQEKIKEESQAGPDDAMAKLEMEILKRASELSS